MPRFKVPDSFLERCVDGSQIELPDGYLEIDEEGCTTAEGGRAAFLRSIIPGLREVPPKRKVAKGDPREMDPEYASRLGATQQMAEKAARAADAIPAKADLLATMQDPRASKGLQ